MSETRVARPPTAANMRLDGGHPALDLVNTVYGQAGEPPEHDVLATPQDFVTFARRVGTADEGTPASASALRAARELHDALDATLRALLAGDEAPPGARAVLEQAGRAAPAAGRLARAPHGAGAQPTGLAWTWDAADAHAPVHRLALAALALLADADELGRLHQCAACCWLFIDHSRGRGRRWCSMADCGTEAKKRRYVERRRERRRRETGC